jgi:hypothetical protein
MCSNPGEYPETSRKVCMHIIRLFAGILQILGTSSKASLLPYKEGVAGSSLVSLTELIC